MMELKTEIYFEGFLRDEEFGHVTVYVTENEDIDHPLYECQYVLPDAKGFICFGNGAVISYFFNPTTENVEFGIINNPMRGDCFVSLDGDEGWVIMKGDTKFFEWLVFLPNDGFLSTCKEWVVERD